MAEQLAFEKSFFQQGTIDGLKRTVAPRAVLVNGSGCEFLACARFTQNQHRRISGSNPGDPPVQLPDGSAFANDFVTRPHLVAKPAVFRSKRLNSLGVIQRQGRETRDRGQQPQMAFVKDLNRIGRVEINRPLDLAADQQWDCQDGCHCHGRAGCVLPAGDVIAEHRDAVAQHLVENRRS